MSVRHGQRRWSWIGRGQGRGGGVLAAELFHAGGFEPAGEFYPGVPLAAAGLWIYAGGVVGGVGRGVASAVDGDDPGRERDALGRPGRV